MKKLKALLHSTTSQDPCTENIIIRLSFVTKYRRDVRAIKKWKLRKSSLKLIPSFASFITSYTFYFAQRNAALQPLEALIFCYLLSNMMVLRRREPAEFTMRRDIRSATRSQFSAATHRNKRNFLGLCPGVAKKINCEIERFDPIGHFISCVPP